MFCLLLDSRAPRFQYKIDTVCILHLGRELGYGLDKVFTILNGLTSFDIHFIILKLNSSQCAALLLTEICFSKCKCLHVTLKRQMFSKLPKAFEPQVGTDEDYCEGSLTQTSYNKPPILFINTFC